MQPDRFIGTELAGYRIDELIGRGGMGVVYRAEHLRLGRSAALKLMAPEVASDARFRERFLRESRLAGSLDHPNVIPIYDAGEADGLLYLAMRYVDGTDLRKLLASEAPLDPPRASAITTQIAAALDAAHSAGLVHRDVKPSNVLLPRSGAGRTEHAYLADFGLTRRTASESGVTATSAFLGTIAYVAPEQIEGRPVDGKADQYSLACVVHQMLTGSPPYERDTDLAVLWAHVSEPPPSVSSHGLDGLAGRVDPLFQRALAKDPADRYASCGEFAAALSTALGSETKQPKPVAHARSAGAALAAEKPSTVTIPRARGLALRPLAIRQLSRRSLVAVGGVAVLAIALAGLLLTRIVGHPTLVGNGAALIDTSTNSVSTTISLPDAPSFAAAGGGAVWVASFDGQSVMRVDAKTRQVTRVALADRPGGIATTSEGALVTNVNDGTLSRLDAGSGQVTATTALLFRPGQVAATNTAVWLINVTAETVVQVDPDSMAIAGKPGGSPAGKGPVGIALTGPWVWVSNRLGASLTQIDAGTGNVTLTQPLSFAPTAIAADSSGLWVLDGTHNAVVHLDSNSGREIARIGVGAGPNALAIGAGAVWTANTRDGTVSRIDPNTNAVNATIQVGGSPVGLVVVGGVAWVLAAQ
jgi:serine/threonine-protein kinase